MAAAVNYAVYGRDDIVKRIIARDFTEAVDMTKWSEQEFKSFDALMNEMKKKVMSRYTAAVTAIGSRSHQNRLTAVEFGSVDYDFLQSAGPVQLNQAKSISCILQGSSVTCKHDICHCLGRLKGVTYLEYETVHHYDLRISAAPRERLKKALRKQRHVQLLEDRKEWNDWEKQVWTKIKTFKNQRIVSVGHALSALRSAALTSDQRIFGQATSHRIAENSDGTVMPWWDSARYLTYFGPVLLSHLDDAITNVSDVLGLHATMYYEVDYCLRAFAEEFRAALTHVPRSRTNSKDVTVAQVLSYLVKRIHDESGMPSEELLSKLPPGGLCDYIVKSATLADQARTKFQVAIECCVAARRFPQEEFAKIKQETLQSSQHTPALDYVLEIEVPVHKMICTLRILAQETAKQPNMQIILHLMQRIDTLTNSCAPLYRQTVTDMRSILLTPALGLFINTTERQTLEHCLFNAWNAKSVEVQAYEEKEIATADHAEEQAVEIYGKNPSLWAGSINETYPEMEVDTHKLVRSYCLNFIFHQSSPVGTTYHLSWFDLIQQNVWRGTIEPFLTYRHFNPSSEFSLFDTELSVLFAVYHDSEDARRIRQPGYLIEYFREKYEHGWCATTAFLRILILMCRSLALNHISIKQIVQNLSLTVQESLSELPSEWQVSICSLSNKTIPLIGYLVVECTHALGRSDIEQVVMSLVWLTMIHVLTTPTETLAKAELDYMTQFLTSILCMKEKHVRDMTDNVSTLLKDEKLRCAKPASCVALTTPNDVVSEKSKSKASRSLSSADKDPATRFAEAHSIEIIRSRRRPAHIVARELDFEIMKAMDQGMDIEGAGKALGYVARRVKVLEQEIADRESLAVLSKAFRKIEEVLGQTPRRTSGLFQGNHELDADEGGKDFEEETEKKDDED